MRIQNVLALESIDFQSDQLFKNISLSMEELQKLKEEELPESHFATAITKAIKEFTGLSFTIEIGYSGPAVEIPKVDKNNILINNFMKNYISNTKGLKIISESANAVRGAVNLKTGKVSGVFTEIEHQLYMPSSLLVSKKYTAEEKAAIVLHEVGHILTYYLYMANTLTTNQVLAGITKGLSESTTIAEREIVLVAAKDALKLSSLDTDKLSKLKDDKVVETVIISSVVREAASELGSNYYDFSSWEYLADQYAARMGAGRHLVTALDKIYSSSWNIAKRGIIGYLSAEALKLATLFLNPFLALLLITIDGAGDGTYNIPGVRLKRVREQLIEQLKDDKLSKDKSASIKEDIKIIDDVLETINERRQFFGVLWDTLTPSGRRNYSQEKLQRELEMLASNDLFKKANEFKTLFN